MNKILKILNDYEKALQADFAGHQMNILLAKEFSNNDFQLDEKFHVEGSAGKGRWTYSPWIMISDGHHTQSAQEGLYIVILFREDFSGFYLSLNQGVHYLENEYKKNCRNVNDKIKSEVLGKITIPIGFTTEPILLYDRQKVKLNRKLFSKLNYESTNICSKFYDHEFDFQILINDIKKLISSYEQALSMLGELSYVEYIEQLLLGHYVSEDELSDDEVDVINVLMKEVDSNFAFTIVEKPNGCEFPERTKKFKGKKTDFIEVAKRNTSFGIKVEQMVMKYEIDRLNILGVKDANQKVKWVSKEIGDGLGFDILSVSIENDLEIDRYIEVKATRGGVNKPFMVTENELEFSKIHKDNYYLYRVYDFAKSNGKMYILNGSLQDNVLKKPTVYKCIPS